jgi:hypothetical protein
MSNLMQRASRTLLIATLALTACNGTSGTQDSGPPDAGPPDAGPPDLCTHSVAVIQKLEGEVLECVPDAGLPADADTSGEIIQCNQQLAGCDAGDESILYKEASCFDELPPLQCQWLMPTDAGLTLAELAWGFEALSCESTQPLSPACHAVTGLPFDGGLPPF